MDPFAILLVGIVIVVGGILLLRLHAFLALTLAALAVGALTPAAAVTWFERTENAGKFVAPPAGETDDDKLLGVEDGDGQPLPLRFRPAKKQIIGPGSSLYAFSGQPSQRADQPLALLVGLGPEGSQEPASKVQVLRVVSGQVTAGDMAAGQIAWRRASETAKLTVAERVAVGFGSTCAKIGILIAMAAIIGKCLLESGAADRIIRSALRLVGEARASLAFLVSGFALGIPVFFDTVFYLMIPLGKALRMRTGRNYLLSILTITAGASMAHSLVPPTPGPLLVAGELGVNLGLMILGGCFVGSFSAAFGYFYAHWINRKIEIPLRDSEDISLKELEKLAAADESQLPPTWLSLLPILLPVILIGGGTLLDPKVTGIELGATAKTLVKTFSNKNVALVISGSRGAVDAGLDQARQPPRPGRQRADRAGLRRA